MGKELFTAKKFIDAMPGTGGIISQIADKVGCTWHTARKYIEKYPTIKRAYEDEKHKVDDKALSNVYKDIAGGSVETSKWWIRMKLGDEFHPTEELVHKVNWDDTNNDSD